METWIPVVLAIVAPAVAGVGWLVKSLREGHLNREIAHAAEKKALQQEIKDLLQERIRYEMVRRESSDQTMAVLNKILEQHTKDDTNRVLAEILSILKARGATQ